MYVKLFNKILDSSIWEESAATRVVWVTLLASMDSDGFCQFATVETLARRARIKPCLVKEAVAILEAPDGHSSTPADDGRRIERVAGGWIVLNAKKYRDISRSGELRKSRPKPSQLVSTGSNSSQPVSSIDVSTNGCNKSLPYAEEEVDIKPTTEVKGGVLTPPESKPPKKRRSKFKFEGFHPDVKPLVEKFGETWPLYRKDHSEVRISKSILADRLDGLLRDGFTRQEIERIAEIYLEEQKDWPACPQHFFGPGNGKSANYSSYAKMVIHQRTKVVTQ